KPPLATTATSAGTRGWPYPPTHRKRLITNRRRLVEARRPAERSRRSPGPGRPGERPSPCGERAAGHRPVCRGTKRKRGLRADYIASMILLGLYADHGRAASVKGVGEVHGGRYMQFHLPEPSIVH